MVRLLFIAYALAMSPLVATLSTKADIPDHIPEQIAAYMEKILDKDRDTSQDMSAIGPEKIDPAAAVDADAEVMYRLSEARERIYECLNEERKKVADLAACAAKQAVKITMKEMDLD